MISIVFNSFVAVLIFFLATLATESARADTLLAPTFLGDAASTLPRGRWLASVTGFGFDVTTRFGGGGDREAISDLFSRDVRWTEVIGDDPVRSAQVQGLLASRGIAADESAGYYRGAFQGQVTGRVPVVGYGITDRLGIFAALPVLDIRVRSRVVYEASDSARRLTRQLRDAGQTSVAGDFETSLNDGFATQLDKAGYDYSESYDRKAVGDLRLELPYIFRPSRHGRAVAFSTTVILPTGDMADPREFYGISTGQERFQVGTRGIFSQEVGRATFTGSAGFLYPFATRRDVRIPRDSLDRLSPDIESRTRVTGGTSYSATVDTRYTLSRSWALRSGFSHQRRFRDHYRGNAFSPERYSYIAGAASERLENFFFPAEADSIRSFLAGDFLIPGRVVGGLGVPVAGRNAVADRIAFLQANLFF